MGHSIANAMQWFTCQGKPGWPALQGCCLDKAGTQSDPYGLLLALSGPGKVKLGLFACEENLLKLQK